MRSLAVIPARFASTRLPGKPLAMIGDKPMIQHVYERVRESDVDDVLVATDDQRIVDVVTGFGGKVVMTSAHHTSGTDRIAEAVANLNVQIVINVQGDEPLLPPQMINMLLRPMFTEPQVQMATLAHPMESALEISDPHVVKVVCDANGFALYFSRSPIPYPRGRYPKGLPQNPKEWDHSLARGFLKHIGIYAYRKDFLQTFAQLSPTFLEHLEQLEQLRVLEHGYKIRIHQTFLTSISVDTPEDLERVRELFSSVQS